MKAEILKPCYYYLNENNRLIYKNKNVVDDPFEYFDGDFARRWWYVENDKDEQQMIEELKALFPNQNKREKNTR